MYQSLCKVLRMLDVNEAVPADKKFTSCVESRYIKFLIKRVEDGADSPLRQQELSSQAKGSLRPQTGLCISQTKGLALLPQKLVKTDPKWLNCDLLSPPHLHTHTHTLHGSL